MAALLAACVLVGAPPTTGPGTGRAAAASPKATDGSYAIVDAAGGVMTFGGAGYYGDTLEIARHCYGAGQQVVLGLFLAMIGWLDGVPRSAV